MCTADVAASSDSNELHLQLDRRKKERKTERRKKRRVAENGGNDVRGKTQGVKANKS